MHYVRAWSESKIREISFWRGVSCTATSRYMQRYRLSVYKWYDKEILWCFAWFSTACTIWWYLFWTFSKWTSIYACKYLLEYLFYWKNLQRSTNGFNYGKFVLQRACEYKANAFTLLLGGKSPKAIQSTVQSLHDRLAKCWTAYTDQKYLLIFKLPHICIIRLFCPDFLKLFTRTIGWKIDSQTISRTRIVLNLFYDTAQRTCFIRLRFFCLILCIMSWSQHKFSYWNGEISTTNINFSDNGDALVTALIH